MEWRAQKFRFAVAKAVIKMAELVPTQRCDRETLFELSKEPTRHPLHSGIPRRAAGIGYINEELHLAVTRQQMN
jgi:hypothetical protein